MFRNFFLTIVIGTVIGFFCESQTKGFRLQEIFSDISHHPQWDVVPLSAEKKKEVDVRLRQPFKYLGSGEQCHAFLGDDQKTVLKFFRHTTLFKKYDPRPAFDSCKLAYEKLQKQTGVIYVHINKTEGEFRRVVLLDNIGVVHEVDLDRTEFLVQEYAELAISRIHAQMKNHDLEGAIGSVRALFQAVKEWTEEGIHMEVPALRRNIGFLGDQVVVLDTGSLSKGEPIQSPEEVRHITHTLGRWIKKHHPALSPYFERELESVHKAFLLEL